MKEVVLCDFDGTIVLNDIIHSILDKFADEKWRYYERLWEQGKIGSIHSTTKQVSMIQADMDKIIYYINKIMIPDPYFLDFIQLCDDKGMDRAIVSDGLDIYIKQFLKNHNLDIKYFTNEFKLSDDAFTISCPYHNYKCGWCCTCKFEVVKSYKKDYDTVYYVGDGLTDKHAAVAADVVFAKQKLIDICKQQDIEYIQFNNFKDIIDYFKLKK